MKKKILAMVLTCSMTAALAACGSSDTTTDSTASDSAAAEETAAAETSTSEEASDGSVKYTDITIGETGTDITADLKFLTHRTDMVADDYAGTSWNEYLAEFNKIYPNITIEIEGITDYAEDSLLRLQGGDWGDIMMIPAVSKADLSTYFASFGTLEDVSSEVNYINQVAGGEVYGIPSTANALGIVYNKKVFEEAGITELPTTPDEFIEDLKTIKENTDAIPLYTNYAAGWTLGAWDAYIGATATGDATYMNQGLLHAQNPFSDPGDGTHPYNVYRVLYEAVADGLIEDDYTTTDWEGSKGMMNRGEIATMVLGSWAVSQMKAAGDNPDDVDYMPFPISVDGKQYSSAAPDYSFGINAQDDPEKIEAAMIFVKWMTEESGFSVNEGGLPIKAGDDSVPDLYKTMQDQGVTFMFDELAVDGEEDLLNMLNEDSELAINNGGNDKIAAIVEAASNGTESFDDIMNEWNQKWTDAQETEGVSVQ